MPHWWRTVFVSRWSEQQHAVESVRVAVAVTTHHRSIGKQAGAPWKEHNDDDLVRSEPKADTKSCVAGTDLASLVHECAGDDVLERIEPEAFVEVEQTIDMLLPSLTPKSQKRKKKAKPEVKDGDNALCESEHVLEQDVLPELLKRSFERLEEDSTNLLEEDEHGKVAKPVAHEMHTSALHVVRGAERQRKRKMSDESLRRKEGEREGGGCQ